MNSNDHDPQIEILGDALNHCANRALEAFAENEPDVAKQVMAEVAAGTAQTHVLVVSGGGQPATVAVTMILADGTKQPLATLRIGVLKFN